MAAEIAVTGDTPLDYLLRVMRNDEAELGVRVFAARSAAPYVHPRLSAVTVTRVSDKETLEELERKAIRLGKKIGLGDLTSLFAAAKH